MRKPFENGRSESGPDDASVKTPNGGMREEELDRIRESYRRFDQTLYNRLRPDRYMMEQEKERIFLSILSRFDVATIKTMKVLEIGCGRGTNILHFLRWGFEPENIKGNELMPHRCAQARHLLPTAIEIIEGDALLLRLPEDSFDIVLASTVFGTIRDEWFRVELAKKIWSLVKPTGAVLWYDFIYNNPANPDVMAVPRRRVVELFPEARALICKVTLAPPIARFVCRVHPRFYSLFNLLPFLRTHLVAWLEKPAPANPGARLMCFDAE